MFEIIVSQTGPDFDSHGGECFRGVDLCRMAGSHISMRYALCDAICSAKMYRGREGDTFDVEAVSCQSVGCMLLRGMTRELMARQFMPGALD